MSDNSIQTTVVTGLKVGDIVELEDWVLKHPDCPSSLHEFKGKSFKIWKFRQSGTVVVSDMADEKVVPTAIHLHYSYLKPVSDKNITPKQMLKNGDRVHVERSGWYVFLEGHLYKNGSEWLNLDFYDEDLNEECGEHPVTLIYTQSTWPGKLLDPIQRGTLKWKRPVCPKKAAAEALVAELEMKLAKAREELAKHE